MINYQDIAIAERFFDAHEKVIKKVVRNQNNLDTYKAKEDANQKAVQARQIDLEIDKRYIDASTELIDRQREMLEENDTYKRLYKQLLQKHEILKKYAESKGVDTSLTDYMFLKDFTL